MKAAAKSCAWVPTARMCWTNCAGWNAVLGPTIKAALEAIGGIDIRAILAKALHMGDDGHNRLDAASVLWTTQLAPYIAKTAKDTATAFEVIKFLGENALSILNPVMAGCKIDDRCR